MLRYSIFMGGPTCTWTPMSPWNLRLGVSSSMTSLMMWPIALLVRSCHVGVADCVVGDASYSGGLCTGVDLRAFFTGGAALGGRCLLLPLVWRFAPGVSMTARIQ